MQVGDVFERKDGVRLRIEHVYVEHLYTVGWAKVSYWRNCALFRKRGWVQTTYLERLRPVPAEERI